VCGKINSHPSPCLAAAAAAVMKERAQKENFPSTHTSLFNNVNYVRGRMMINYFSLVSPKKKESFSE
jgi:hypothetical protein